ncbi:MAG: tol-pal system protein YbgF [Pseudomonadota bacterium]|nr:tol-pal system protein YbgF [Pseudomonadota bacterium]
MVASVRLAAQAVAVVGFFVSASAALAQDMSQIIDRLNRLERDLADTQREVFRPSAKPRTGSVISTPLTPNAAPPVNTGEVPLIARHEIRLQQLENQLRNLTGRIEEFTFSINQFGKRLDRLVSDVDYRLQRLEAAQVSAGTDTQAAAATAGQSQTSQPSAATPNGGRPVPPALGDNDGAVLDQQGTRALGQIPASAAAAKPAQTAPQVAAVPPPILPAGTPRQRYDFAFGLLRKQDYAGAEAAFEAFLTEHPQDNLAGNAQYWLAETYYVRKQFEQAAIVFAAGYQNYPDNIKAADNLLKLALSLARIDKQQDACVALKQLGEKFPKAPSNIRRRAAGEGRRLGCAG